MAISTSNLKSTNMWAVRPDGRIIGLLYGPPKTVEELYDAMQQLVASMQSLPTSQNVSSISTRIAVLENVDFPQASDRLTALEAKPAATPKSVTDVAARVATLEGKPIATPQSVTDVASRIATLEAKPAPVIPKPATTAPPPVALQGSAGTSTEYALKDHTHEARTQRKVVTLDGNGLATWTFAKPFENKPSLNYMVFQPTGTGKVVVDAVEWVMSGTKYAGVKVSGSRSQKLPQSPPVSPLAFLGNVITGVNNLISGLSGYDIFAGGNLNGVEVHLSAGDQI